MEVKESRYDAASKWVRALLLQISPPDYWGSMSKDYAAATMNSARYAAWSYFRDSSQGYMSQRLENAVEASRRYAFDGIMLALSAREKKRKSLLPPEYSFSEDARKMANLDNFLYRKTMKTMGTAASLCRSLGKEGLVSAVKANTGLDLTCLAGSSLGPRFYMAVLTYLTKDVAAIYPELARRPAEAAPKRAYRKRRAISRER